MSSFLNPFNVKYGEVNGCMKDLQIENIVRTIYSDASKKDRIVELLSNICIDKETIIYRQEILKDFMFNRALYYDFLEQTEQMKKCFRNYNATCTALSKSRIRSDSSITETSMILKDFSQSIKLLIKIYHTVDHLLKNNPISSTGLRKLKDEIDYIINKEEFNLLESKCDQLIDSVGAFAFQTVLDDRLIPQETKYIIETGKYQEERVSIFKRKAVVTGNVELNSKSQEDFKSLLIDSFYKIVSLFEDIFEYFFEKISFIHEEILFFDFGIKLYDKMWERNINSIFPEIGEETEYKNVYDPYLVVMYAHENYSERIYGNDDEISKENDVLVVGNNNSGKTVLLRTIGINQVFAQSGLFVPATKATVGLVNEIVTIFSGEEKDTDNGGRFEKEVIEISEIIDKVNTKSLVIINEIFQSTFAADGMDALFNVLDYFSNIHVKWVAVTHLLGILDRKNSFCKPIDVYTTTCKEEKYKIKKV